VARRLPAEERLLISTRRAGTPGAFSGVVRHLATLLLFSGIAWLAHRQWESRPIQHEPGVLVPVDPQQEDVAPTPLASFKDFRLTGVARYAICGRVLGTKRYWDAPESDLVPVDVALGWGPMSDQAVLDQLGISMGNRFFFYRWEGAPPCPPGEIMRHASNHHVISATADVKRQVASLREGEIVVLRGWLVDIAGPDGWTWSTSRRRDDTGRGACELFYVEALDRIAPEAMAALRRKSVPLAAGQ
jgi:hypothetical protein